MIASLRGKLLFKNSTSVIIECAGVGYFINITVPTYDKLPEPGIEIFLHTIYQSREDAVTLFGFLSPDEKDAFQILNSVSGIGGKTALGILSSVTVSELIKFISSQNLTALQKLPGIGKKTAERLCFELKDKIMNISGSQSKQTEIEINESAAYEAVSALVSLGYTRNVAEKAVKSAQQSIGKDAKVESLIKVALKYTMN